MDTRVAGTDDAPVYVMLLELAAGGADLTNQFAALGVELGVDVALQALESEAL
jgi:hypothetical protein